MPKQKTVVANVETLKVSVKSLFFVSLAFAPAALVTLFIGGTVAVLAFYSLALFTLLVVIAGLFSEALLVLGAGFASLFNTSTHGWRKATFISMLWSVLAVGAVAVVTENPWIAVVTVIVTLANWWAVSGALTQRGRRIATGDQYQEHSAEEMRHKIAGALMDYFAPESKPSYKAKTQEGETYINHNLRLEDSLARVTDVRRLSPNVFEVDLRNDVGKGDDSLVTAIDAAASQIGLHDWSRKDRDKRRGYVTVTVWATERRDATTLPHGFLMWQDKENQL